MDVGWDPELQALLEDIREAIAKAETKSFKAGKDLLKAKEKVKARKQSWEQFVADAGLEKRTCNRLMNVAEYEPFQNPTTLSEMPSDYTTREQLTKLTKGEFHAAESRRTHQPQLDVQAGRAHGLGGEEGAPTRSHCRERHGAHGH